MKKFILITIILGMTTLGGCFYKKETNQQAGQSAEQNKTTDNVFAKVGSVVEVDYIGTFEDGKVFDTSLEDVAKKSGVYTTGRDYKPLEFTVGAGQMIKGFDEAVVGMQVGQTKNIKLMPKDAYGEYDPNKIQVFKRSDLKQFEDSGIKIETGNYLPTQYGNLKIIEVSKDDVKVDFNHPMAGKVLNFQITLKAVKK